LGKLLRLEVTVEGAAGKGEREEREGSGDRDKRGPGGPGGQEGKEGYRIPPDNPFTGRPGWRPEIWALGLRNPWRFSFDRVTGDLYIADVGQDSREEVNFEAHGSTGGRNYGWNAWEGTLRFRRDVKPATPVTFPVAEYATRQEGCSVTGCYVYRGRRVPALFGIYVFGDFCSGRIWGLKRAGKSWKMARLLDTEARISSFGEDEEGELYVVDYGGRVLRFVPGDIPVPEELR
jgi:glucose/arabinose dehydrogenase